MNRLILSLLILLGSTTSVPPATAAEPALKGCDKATAPAAEPEKQLRLEKIEKPFSYYRGSVVVSGIYHEKIRESEIGNFEAGLICFTVQGPTKKLIPHEDDAGFPWFFFSNTVEARTALKVPRVAPDGTCYIVGTATVQISKYVANNYPSEVHDKANLDKVIVSDHASFKKECSLF